MATTQAGDVGTLVSLWRYPVKSMQGEELNVADTSERGLLGDRAYALLDRATNKVVSAKRPRWWGQLFDCHATFVEPPRAGQPLPSVRMTLPDGTTVTTTQQDIDHLLTHLLGRDVTLLASAPPETVADEYWLPIEGVVPVGDVVANSEGDAITTFPVSADAPAGTFFDAFPIHLLTTATLNRLREAYPQGRFETRRFRPNLVVAPPSSMRGFVENDWVGRTLVIGDEVRLRVSIPCPRCVMTTLPQSDLPSDAGILKAAVQHNQVPIGDAGPMASVGVYAEVLQGGVIHRGDTVSLA